MNNEEVAKLAFIQALKEQGCPLPDVQLVPDQVSLTRTEEGFTCILGEYPEFYAHGEIIQIAPFKKGWFVTVQVFRMLGYQGFLRSTMKVLNPAQADTDT